MGTRICYPKVGTTIDGGRLELVSVIGTGGYGHVYKARDASNALRPYYAVKCLPHSRTQCQSRLREITLHRRASAHPGTITLFQVISDDTFMYLVMDYAPDRDLFTQILQERRYLGNDVLIKSTFLQILDVVEYCHSVGVYHRDLKPENFVCFEGGSSVALTDFGLATTERRSTEFQTGSVYHMSPECAEMNEGAGYYSPQACDIWSLGIILINLVTGRNPWDCAIQEDPAFRSYRQNPYRKFPSVLPVSEELNAVLVGMLCMEWRARPAISEIRAAVRGISSFYARDVVFEGNMAKCAWEGGRYKRPVGRRVDMTEPRPPRRHNNLGNNNQLRARILREKFHLYEEEEDSDDSGGTHDDSDAMMKSASDLAPSFERRLKARARASAFGALVSGIQRFFMFCPGFGRKKTRVVRFV